MEGRPLTIFYCFTGLSAFLFMFSTIFAILQILMVYEMSDDKEVEAFFELLGNDTQLPGAFFFIGMVCFCVPMASYIVSNVTMGLEKLPSASVWGDWTIEQKVQLSLSFLLAAITALMLMWGFLYQIPALISYVYAAKKEAAEKDEKTLDNDWADTSEGKEGETEAAEKDEKTLDK